MTDLRIAAVKQTGKKYIVSTILNIGTPKAKVACLGEVVSWKQVNSKGNCSWKYEGKKVFLKDFVEITNNVPNTVELFKELSKQYISGLREKNHIVTFSKSGKTYTDHGTAKDIENRAEAEKRLNDDMKKIGIDFQKVFESLK